MSEKKLKLFPTKLTESSLTPQGQTEPLYQTLMPTKTTTIGLADDHALFLTSLKTILQKDLEFTVLVEANNGKTYLENAWN
ncbi:MAG: response regulator transcription factor, partial [Pedobacter sp.]